jgi:uncharacterized protein YrrD
MIERGWVVADRDGSEIGQVRDVLGDMDRDIFHGLAVATNLVGRARFVPAERVGEIVEGHVETDLAADEVERLEPSA